MNETDTEPYPHLPKWENCVDCGQPVRHKYTRWCTDHDPTRTKPIPWYLWPLYVPLLALSAFLILALMALISGAWPY